MDAARVMIVEDEVIVAEDLSRGLRACGYDVAGYAVSSDEAIDLAHSVMPDLILMDVALGDGFDGISLARTIANQIDVPIVFVTAYSADSCVDEAVRAGAAGYVVKPFQIRQVTAAIKVALQQRGRGNAGVQNQCRAELAPGPFAARLQRVQALLADDMAWTIANAPGSPKAVRITAREREIIQGLVCYRRLSTVASELGISVHTARNHLKSTFRKLNLHSQDELLRFLLEGETA
jgi:DNA-binding NarL/FixJ family response regulator